MTRLLSYGMPRKKAVPPPDAEAPIYIVGYFHAASGLGESARLYWRELSAQRAHVYAVDITQQLFQQPHPGIFDEACLTVEQACQQCGLGTVVVHVNPATILLALILLRKLCKDKRIIGYWAWELEDIPDYWVHCLKHVDAVEAPSRFIAHAIAKHTTKPVTVHPHAMPAVRPSQRRFAEDGVVRILFMFDAASNFYRKNPQAAVHAFRLAFGEHPNFQLTLKANSLHRCPAGEKALRKATGGQPNITLIQEHLTAQELDGLYRQNDIYISLHRAEGYGLSIHEAMQYGLHVVATDWSGNTDFMQGHKVHAVPYHLVPVEDPRGHYTLSGTRWAEAHVPRAAAALRSIVTENMPGCALPEAGTTQHTVRAEDVAIILVNYQAPELTLQCLDALEKLTTSPRNIVVVDNASQDDSVQTILHGWKALLPPEAEAPAQLEAPQAVPTTRTVLPLSENRGFAAGNNAALRLLENNAPCRAYWLLNSDTIPSPDALDALCARLSAVPEAGACGSTLVRLGPKQRVQCAAGNKLNVYTGETSFLCDGLPLEAVRSLVPETQETQLDEIAGASLLIRKEALEDVGYMPEEYFLYREDSDWSLALRRKGWKLAWAPESIILHAEGGSTGVGHTVPPTMDYLLLRNRVYLMKKYYPRHLPTVLLRLMLVFGKRLAQGKWQNARHVVRACAQGLTGSLTKDVPPHS